MRSSHKLYSILITLIAVAFWNSAGIAQQKKSPEPESSSGEKFVIEALPDRLARRVESQTKMLRQFGLSDPDKTPKGVINAMKVWSSDYPVIRVCFFSGPQHIRAQIAKIAMEWRQAVPTVALDFGDLRNPRLCKATETNHIRIGFGFAGYWSLVGMDSTRLAGQDEQSMNFEGFDTAPPNESEFRATVLHEFGHAIGLEHEHQNPLAKCRDEFDWPKIYRWLGGPPNNWSKETVDFNMGQLNEPGLLATTFDRRSIMLYTFPASYFIRGSASTCYSPTNMVLSDDDKRLVAELYPGTKEAKDSFVNRVRDHLRRLIKASGQSEGAKSGVLQLIDEYVPERRAAVAPKQ